MTAEPVEEERVEIPLDERTSYSALSSYTYCAKQFELERVKKVPKRPAWYLVGGTVFHEWTEIKDRAEQEPPAIKRSFMEAVETEEEESGFPRDEWMSGGRASKAYPAAESERWWLDHLPEMCDKYLEWREATNWAVWETPADRKSAIELPLEFNLGGLVVRAAVDRVFVLKSGALAVVDIKTGARIPSSLLQPGTYATGIQLVHGVRPKWGCFYDARKGKPTALGKLEKYTPALLAEINQQYQRGIRAGVYLPNLGSHCMSCSVRPYCLLGGGGDLAQEFDDLAQFDAPF